MGQGQDKIALSLLDLQPTAIVELFLLYFNTIDKEGVYIAFHGGSVFSRGIKWQGVEYLPVPVESEGFEVNANGQMARPKIRISNKDYFMTDLLLNNHDLQFAKIVRKRTFVKYLDDANFDGGNPWGQADASAEVSNDTFVVSQKTAENKTFVELELTSPLDLDNFDINNRLILSRYCSWYYRGNGCKYAGPPIETEDGRKINYSGQWNLIKDPWFIGKYFESGELTYIENKKIIVDGKPAKVWYVCQTGHSASSQYQPGSNDTYWLRDGCNKKLDGCKKRFQNAPIWTSNTVGESITNNYVDFSHKAGYNAYNNIAPLASVTASSEYSISYSASNINNLQTGSFYSWQSSGTSAPDPWVSLQWNSPKTIDRIDLYDRPETYSNFSGAYITFYNGASLVKSGILSNIPTNGSRITSGFSSDPVTVTSITISGSGCNGAYPGLSEVCVFEPTGLGLYNTSFQADNISSKDYWQLSSWVQFPNGISQSKQYTNVLHNVKSNCQSSGINLYLSGVGSSQELILDFATAYLTGSLTSSGYAIYPRQLSIKWSAQNMNPFHIFCSGGTSTGTRPTAFKEGYISLSGAGQIKTFTIAPPSGKVVTRGNTTVASGEFFVFKNTAFNNGMGDLKFGINDWQFSELLSTPSFNDGTPESNLKITSNIRLGSTAIWTGSLDYGRTEFFNRTDEKSTFNNSVNVGLKPRKYSELQDNHKIGLYDWWGMNLSDSAPYEITGENVSTRKIILSGQYTGSMDYSDTVIYYANSSADSPQTFVSYLPFGGFPGTEKYGR
jgi:lambda family phage minor tail protein L